MENIEIQKEAPKRPTFLTVLAVLSFITIGLGLLGGLTGLLSGPLSQEEIDEIIAQNMKIVDQLNDMGSYYWSDALNKTMHMVQYTNNNFYVNQLITVLGYAVGLAGVILMLRGKKTGFHLYIIYNLLSLLVVYASVPVSEVPAFIIIFNAFFALLFIFMYSRNLHYMK